MIQECCRLELQAVSKLGTHTRTWTHTDTQTQAHMDTHTDAHTQDERTVSPRQNHKSITFLKPSEGPEPFEAKVNITA